MKVVYNRRKSLLLTLILVLLAAMVLIPLRVFRYSGGESHSLSALEVPLSPDEIPHAVVWGIDISHHQRVINWSRLSVRPDFIFLKSTEGRSHTDTRFKQYYRKSRQHRIITGAYHFFSFRVSGKEQARHFIQNTPLNKGDLPPVLDVEWSRRLPSPEKVAREVTAWLSLVEKHYGARPIIYSDEQFYNAYLKGRIRDKYPLWLCDFKNQPHGRWSFWQRTDRFLIEGIVGTVDLNYFNGSLNDLKKLTLKN